MPTLIRIIVVLALLFGAGYAALWALANWVEPQEREITLTVQPERIER
ncbi:hypothetical protein [Xanthobacter tagetidis]|jgi:phage shock protein PspC (stress-responsive transcriptional regulator)|nr:hypothetical protein [Xanthobacter tagetidis]MBB6306548.1 phage shock protein PspC (stress-responsive transcriptional regulator) [Xanthobacter tagetidis]